MTSVNSPKPELFVRLDADAEGSLTALGYLSRLKEERLYHAKLDKRHPLGIYNTSILRICRKIKKCSETLETYMAETSSVESSSGQNAMEQELVDYLELCLYAAAEHVDDIVSIARCIFSEPKQFDKSGEVKKLKKAMKPIRDRVSAFANSMKHNQGRIRIFSNELVHENNKMCLHGLFIESYSSGSIGPCPILHPKNENIISITSFLWDIVIFIFETSGVLTNFLKSSSVVHESDVTEVSYKAFSDAILALARLPIYSFDDVHPFNRVRVVIEVDEVTSSLLKSGIYGSLRDPWAKGTNLQFGKLVLRYEGDGVTRSFRHLAPTALKLQYWE